MRNLWIVLILITAVALPTGAQQVRQLPSGTPVQVQRAVLVISVGRDKVSSKTEKELLELVRILARSVRDVSGVRLVQPVWFTRWRDAAKRPTLAPWTPYGVVVFVEGTSKEALQRTKDAVWARATKVDQEMIEMAAVDNWD